MPDNLLNRRQEFLKVLLESITQLTQIPVGLYENHDGQVEEIIPEASRANYEEHCKLIQSFPSGKAKCESDQIRRAKAAFKTNQSVVKECCWAGVYNECVPIKIDDKPIALLVYGEMQLDGEDHENESMKKHQQAVATLRLGEREANALKASLSKVKRYSQQDFATLKNLLSKAEQLMYAMQEEQKGAKYTVEKNTHEINTRLQSVIAYAENLVSQIKSADFEEAKKTAQNVLNSAESLDTVVQNLGDYLEEYRFKRQSLTALIEESIGVYGAEAERRGIQLITKLNKADWPQYWVDISRRHLQYALNNLIHNAIKYSFHGGGGLRRYVEIEGHVEKNFYSLTISNYGVGILPEEYDRIFQDGYQGSLTRSEYRTGSGKGLHFVKRTVDRHHGKIDVESTLKADKPVTPEGNPHVNKFTIRLPYHQPRKG